MLFKQNKFNKINTILSIDIQKNYTEVKVLVNKKIQDENDHILKYRYGYNDVLQKAYEEACFFDENFKALGLDLFFEENYNKVFPEIESFTSRLYFQILCKMKIPHKIDKVEFKGKGSELFKSSLKTKFPNGYIVR